MITTKQATEVYVPPEIISWSPAIYKQTTFWNHTTQLPLPGEAGTSVFGTVSAGNISATVTSAWMTDKGCTGIHI